MNIYIVQRKVLALLAEKHSYDYYDGRQVVCHGTQNGDYSCRKVEGGIFPVILPHLWYLYVVPAGQEIGCIEYNGNMNYTTMKVDVIGSIYPDKAASVLLYKKDGSESICVTAD